MKVGLLSDTHGFFDDKLMRFFNDVDELWHAGDIGNIETADKIAAFKPLRSVHGNIDGANVRIVYPRIQIFTCAGMNVFMVHIGGYPGRYENGILNELKEAKPQLFISGHSHILKVIYDKKNDWLHMNPGAAGISGFHQVRTAIRFTIENGEIKDLEIGEWKRN
ncbi:MAG: metallophosphatase family protein [Prevotellaceae bacterium]|jgi:putative phosphoesterase|nr:metallophosphatase family protein [Prevotellaceae bacterium]